MIFYSKEEILNPDFDLIKERIKLELIGLSPETVIKDIKIVEINKKHQVLIEYDRKNTSDKFHKEKTINRRLSKLNKIYSQRNSIIKISFIAISTGRGGIKNYLESVKSNPKIEKKPIKYNFNIHSFIIILLFNLMFSFMMYLFISIEHIRLNK